MIVPAAKRLLVKTLEKSSSGGIILNQSDLMDPTLEYGEVVSETSTLYPQGTKVYYSKYSVAKILDGKTELYIIPEVDVMAHEV
jgi:co-chaperonin GroES (HSP10)